MDRLLVRDIMTERLVCVGRKEDLNTVNDLMWENHIRHLPVVNEAGDLMGIVSQRDIVAVSMDGALSIPVSERKQLLEGMRVDEIMTRGVETVEATEDAAEAGRVILENKMGCLPVVEGPRLIGIVTEADFVQYVIDQETARSRRDNQRDGIRRARAY